MNLKQRPPSRLEAAYAVIGLLQAQLVARNKHIAELHAQLRSQRPVLPPKDGAAAGRKN